MTLDEKSIGCAIVKIQENDNKPIKLGELKDGPRFRVRYEDIESSIQHINEKFEEYGMNNYIVYITGFDIVKEYDIWTEERIDDIIKSEAKRKGLIKILVK